ncbi:MAG: hypothetical protein U0V45_07080 [Flavobacteriales bacterium]
MLGSVGCALAFNAALVLRYKQPRFGIHHDGLLQRCLVLRGFAFTIWGRVTNKA